MTERTMGNENLTRLEADEQARRYRRTWDEFEARVREQIANPAEAKPLELGQAVAWMIRDNGKANDISAVHHYYENGQTFCRLAIPPIQQHLPVLPSLDKCRRCEAMSRRAVRYAKLGIGAELRASA